MVTEHLTQPLPGDDLNETMQRKILEAIQPILANVGQLTAEGVQPRDAPPSERTKANGGPSTPQAANPGSSGDTGANELQRAPRSQDLPPPGEAVPSEEEGFGPALQFLMQGLEQRAEQGLGMVLDAGLHALLSKSLRDTVEREVEQIVHEGIVRAVAAAPTGDLTKQLESQVEKLVQAILPDILDSIFGGPIGAEIESHGRRAVRAALRKDFQTAQVDSREALIEALDGVLRIVRGHQREVLEAAILVLTTLSKEAITAKVGGTAGSIANDAMQAIENRASDLTGKVELATNRGEGQRDGRTISSGGHTKERVASMTESKKRKDNPIRDELMRAGSTLRDQIAEETNSLKSRLGEHVKTAFKEGHRENFGRPPSVVRPPKHTGFGHPPSRKAPSARPPSARRRSE